MFAQLALRADRFCDTRLLEAVYKQDMFHPATIKPQDASLFMALPVELRLMVFDFVFTPPYNKTHNILSILATCRKVHGEAIVPALKTTQFHIDGSKGLVLQSKLWALGDLQQHLRRIDISMPIQKLNGNSGNNPFLLTNLPLTRLEIDFGKIEDNTTWFQENRIYHRLISALLHESTPATFELPSGTLHKSMVEKNKRRVQAALLKPWATKEQLLHMVAGMKAKMLIVKCADDSRDILWSAFTHFALVNDILTVIRVGGVGGQKHKIMFYDDEGQSFLEIGH